MPKIINPTNNELLYEYKYLNKEELNNKISIAENAYLIWKKISINEKIEKFQKLANLMIEKKEELAKVSTLEMGMLYTTAIGDVTKSAKGINYVTNKTNKWTSPIFFDEEGISGKRVFEPMGIIYTVSPWNFPYNQVFRNATSNIMAGNVVLSKHSSNVVGVARKIEELFLEAGFPEGVYQNIEINSDYSEYIISHKSIKGANITGGDFAGRAIGQLAGKYLKPSILELGGNDPFILIDTKDLNSIVKLAKDGRLSNCGQKCNSAKRFIILEKYYDDFCKKLSNSFSGLKVGDPFNKDTDIGPLAKESSIIDLEKLIINTVKKGAKILTGGTRLSKDGYYFKPTVIADVTPEMDLFNEESFGPVASIIKAKDIDHAIKLANTSNFGLTATVITENKDIFEKIALNLETGNVFHNKIPTSYPFLPYGGVKDSGYGKELGEKGMKNFMNEKVIVY